MGFYEELMEGLKEALACSEGKGQGKAKLVFLDDRSLTSFETGGLKESLSAPSLSKKP